MSRRWVAPAVAVAAIGTVAAVGVGVAPAAGRSARPHPTTVPVDVSTAVCPRLSGGSVSATTMTVADVQPALVPPSQATASVSYRVLAPGSKAVRVLPRPVAGVDMTGGEVTVAVTARGAGAGSVVADQRTLVERGPNRAELSAPCLAPGTDWWLTGLDGRIGYADLLVLANPGTTPANVTVTAWSLKGPLHPPRLQSFPVAPRSATMLKVASYAPDAGAVSFHVHANTGRVVAEGLDHRYLGLAADGSDWVPPTQPPATHVVVPGFPGGPGYRLLIVSNPGNADATVQLRLFTSSGGFAPAGHQTLVVPAGRSGEVDLAGGLNRAVGAVRLTSDAPVVAAAVSQEPARGLRSEIQWQPAGAALSGPSVLVSNLPPLRQLCQLLLTATGAGARVRISSPFAAAKVVAVPGGRTLAVYPAQLFSSADAAYGPLVLTPLDPAPVFASRTLFALGAHGTLITAGQPSRLPSAVTLPPVVEDPRAALR